MATLGALATSFSSITSRIRPSASFKLLSAASAPSSRSSAACA
eukprot:CAMPEP_0119527528 /NCGR_PEP_ID=MMETSP1344-20130328/41910_1 /TAXON_ID=236787 /ORGANISM="Florenciella parvula, Strain CCMP2471" /LENGTH=42 /DNA_ID= /DNA_START= /DNA_END= /DNA_ORIENTATION=